MIKIIGRPPIQLRFPRKYPETTTAHENSNKKPVMCPVSVALPAGTVWRQQSMVETVCQKYPFSVGSSLQYPPSFFEMITEDFVRSYWRRLQTSPKATKIDYPSQRMDPSRNFRQHPEAMMMRGRPPSNSCLGCSE